MKILSSTKERLIIENKPLKHSPWISLVFWINLCFSILVYKFNLLAKPSLFLFALFICCLLIHFLFPLNKKTNRVTYCLAIILVSFPGITGILLFPVFLLFICSVLSPNITIDLNKNKNTFSIQYEFLFFLCPKLTYPLCEIVNVTAEYTDVYYYYGSSCIPALVFTKVKRNNNQSITKTIPFNYSVQEATIAAELIKNFLASVDVSQYSWHFKLK